jgi:hypothetical protein
MAGRAPEDESRSSKTQARESQDAGERSMSDITGALIDAGLKVHKALGPGLLESVYEHCLAHELARRGLSVRRQVWLPIVFEGLKLPAG